MEQRKVERTCWRFRLSSSEPGDAADFSATVCMFALLKSTGQNKAKKIKSNWLPSHIGKCETLYEHPVLQ